MITTLPFQGFYESNLIDAIDREVTDTVDRLLDGDHPEFEDPDFETALGLDPDTTKTRIWEIVNDNTDHGAIRQAVAALYLVKLEDFINEEFDLDIKLPFESLVSPREYNFSTDRVFAEITFQDVRKLYKEVGWMTLHLETVKQFTRRDGFMPLYEPVWSSPNGRLTWGHRKTWDHNQVGCIIEALLSPMENWVSDVEQRMNEGIMNIVSKHTNWTRINWILGNLLQGLDNDGREYPIEAQNLQRYVAAFVQQNHYR